MEYHLQKHIAQFLAKRRIVLFIYGVKHLIALLKHTGLQTFMCLHPVPRTAVFAHKHRNGLYQAVKTVHYLNTSALS